MKILPVFSSNKDKKTSVKKSTGGLAETSKSFISELEDKAETEYEHSIEALLNDLEDSEKKMIDSQSMYELAEYKKVVQKILEVVTSEGFETRTLKRRRNANRADFFIVKKIDQKIKELALSLTSPQNKAFNMVKECEEIRGLIFDLLH